MKKNIKIPVGARRIMREGGLGSLPTSKEDKISWDQVMQNARSFGYSPKEVLEMIFDKFDRDFYVKTSYKTFLLCAVYQDRLNQLKKEEKPYSAQTYILEHYPSLVDIETFKLMHQKRTKPKYKIKETREKLRSKRNIIPRKYKRILKHPNWKSYYDTFYRSTTLQDIKKKFFVSYQGDGQYKKT